MSETRNPLTSPQLSVIHTHYQSQLAKIVEAMNLRKWLVEQTIKTLNTSTYGPEDLVTLLDKLHTFITSPSLEGIAPPKDESQ